MGAAHVAPLRAGHGDVITAALGVGPQEIPSSLVPLLDLDLHGLCEAYRRLSERNCRMVDSGDLEKCLGLPSLASKVIAARRSSVPVLELLTLLAVLSHTHAKVKARFIHSAADRSGTGRLCLTDLRSAAASLFRAVCFLAQVPRGQWPKIAAADVLVQGLIDRHPSGVHRDASVAMMMSDGCISKMFHRFTRGAVDQHFVLAKWHDDKLAIKEAEGEDHGLCLASVLPKYDVTQPKKVKSNCEYVSAPPQCLYEVTSRRRPRNLDSDRATPQLSYNESFMDSTELDASLRTTVKSQNSNRSNPQKPQSGIPGGVPRRRGYFTAARSQKELELIDKLKRLQQEKIDLSQSKDLDLDSTICRAEEDVRKKLREEVANEDYRYNYRQSVEEVRNGVINPPEALGNIPRGRFWTASEQHARCGGVLPPNCSRPITPQFIQDCIKRQRAARDGRVSPEAHPNLERTLAFIRGLNSPGGSSLMSVKHGRLGEVPSSVQSSISANDDGRSRNRRAIFSIGAVQEDVELAFELFRAWYWRNDNIITHRNQRDSDIEAILSEAERDSNPWSYPCTQHVKSLRSFFATIWPGMTQSHFKQMQKWIEGLKTVESFEVSSPMENSMRQAETLRELIELFDAIDETGTGLVPLEAVERFLCGELLTEREEAQLKIDRKLDCGRGGGIAGCAAYIDYIKEHRRYRFMTMQVQDKEEWSVRVSEHERRWAGLQNRFSVNKGSSGLDQPTKSKQILSKTIGHRMERLARVLDDLNETGREQPRGGEQASSKSFMDFREEGAIPCEDLDVACTPRLIPQHIYDAPKDVHRDRPKDSKNESMVAVHSASAETCDSSSLDQQGGRLRLVRLYWRYLLGSAVQEQLRESEQPSYLNLRPDGQIDLVSFICILAHDQLRGLFPKGAAPTADIIRTTAYAN